jgi:hypothetical protein
MVSQFVQLERRTSRAGRDTVDHAPGGHDDVANAVAGALVMVGKPLRQAPQAAFGTFDGPYGSSGAWRGVQLRYEDLPAAEWARRGFWHPNDKQKWIDRGILPPETKETAK